MVLRRIPFVLIAFLCAASASLPAAAQPLAKGDTTCRAGLAKGVQKLSRTVFKERTRCERSRMQGKLGPLTDCANFNHLPLSARNKITKAEAKAKSSALKSCRRAAPPQQNGYLGCPAPCAGRLITTAYDSVPACLTCVAHNGIDVALEETYGQPPAGGDLDDEAYCQDRIGKAFDKYFSRRSGEQSRCQKKHDGGRIAPEIDCKTNDSRGKLTRAREQGDKLIERCESNAIVTALDSCGDDILAAQDCVANAVELHADALFDDVYFPSAPPPATPTPTTTPTPLSALACIPDSDCLSLEVQPGPNTLAPTDNGSSSWYKITNLVAFLGLQANNGSRGDFNPGPILITKSQSVDPNGRATLVLSEPAIVGAGLPAQSEQNQRVCFHIEQDPNAPGWIDCDGGSNADVSLSVDSNAANPAGASTLVVGSGAGDSGSGAAVLNVIVRIGATASLSAPCSTADFSSSTPIATSLTTTTATSTVFNVRQHTETPATYPQADTQVALSGQPLDCGNFAAGSH